MDNNLYRKLEEYARSSYYPFHMPGHKRNVDSGPMSEFYSLDITEIDGFDNLYYPDDILLRAQEKAAAFYHAKQTFFLVNGSTVGILSAISAAARRSSAGYSGKIIVARNCHRSVYHAALINALEVVCIYPKQSAESEFAGSISPTDVDGAINGILKSNPEDSISAVVVTSPTYEGVLSDIDLIAEVTHRYGIPLIVDQAHGAHFGIHPDFPETAVIQGADVVVHSLHKTLPAPTQTALLHVCGSLIDSDSVRRFLGMYQTSSPSYPLMAGIDSCIDFALTAGKERLEKLLEYRSAFFHQVKACNHIYIGQYNGMSGCKSYGWSEGSGIKLEPGKIIISVRNTNMSGKQLYDCLRDEYYLQMEMAAGSYVVAILSMMDKQEGLQRLADALCEIDRRLVRLVDSDNHSYYNIQEPLQTVKRMDKAYYGRYEEIYPEQAINHIGADFISIYPPGIPVIIPGELISREVIIKLEHAYQHRFMVQGMNSDGKIRVLKEE